MKKYLGAAALFGSAAMACGAFAQSTGAPEAQPAAPSPTNAAPTASLAEVVVTANRRSENLQNVPVAVTAVSAVALATSGVSNVQGLSTVVAGLNVQQNDGFETARLRGVGSSIIGPGLESPIALYVDGVYYASTTSSLVDLVNVADVQVLKGPQGTLFGRNATGGLIQITTRTPTQTPHFDADFSYGNYDTSKIDAYVSGGLMNNLAADLAVELGHQGDGYGTNLATGQDVYKNDFDGSVRSKWVFTPTDRTKITAAVDYSQDRDSGNVLTLEPGTLASPASASYTLSNPWDTEANVQPLIFSKGGGLSLRLDQDLGFARLMDIAAYRVSHTRLDFDVDFTPIPILGINLLDREHQFSQEIQLQSEPNQRIKWAAGIYYFDGEGKYAPGSIVNSAPVTSIALIGEEQTTSAAGYFQASTEVLPKTNLTVGARYTYERRDLDAQNIISVTGVPLPVAVVANTAFKDFYRPTFRVSLDHRFSAETLGYASFNTGFKSGGFNTQTPFDPSFAPEFLKAYEIGFKNDLFDRRLRADISGFYYDYTNVQITHLEAISSGISNGPPAEIYGLDLDTQARVTEAFKLGAQLEYLHDRFVGSLPLVPISQPQGGVPLVSGSAQGNRLPVTPDAVLDLTSDYTIDLFGGRTNFNATYQYNTGWYAEPDNVIHQAPFSRLNLSIRWTSPTGRYTASLWSNNITDAVVQSAGTTQLTGVHDVQYEAPRTFGFTIGIHG